MSCTARLISAFSNGDAAELAITGGPQLDTQPAGSVGIYHSLACSTPSLQISPTGAVPGQPFQVPISFNASSALSVLAYIDEAGVPSAQAYPDATAALAANANNIDVCGFRVMNAAAEPIDVNTVTAKCTLDCLKSSYVAAVSVGAATPYDTGFACGKFTLARLAGTHADGRRARRPLISSAAPACCMGSNARVLFLCARLFLRPSCRLATSASRSFIEPLSGPCFGRVPRSSACSGFRCAAAAQLECRRWTARSRSAVGLLEPPLLLRRAAA